MNIWFLTSATLLAGITIGAVGFAAAERHFRPPETVGAGDKEVEVSTQRDPAQLGPALEGAVEPRPQSESEDKAQRWRAMHEALLALGQRVTELEEQMAAVSADVNREAAVTAEPETPTTGRLDQQTLLAAGVEPGVASEYLRRQNRLEMERLELRDRASRQGWLDSDRFLEQMGKLEADAGALREEIGDDSYDRFLYLTGQPNRVLVDSVIDGSPAQLAGMEAGDIVLDYADSRVFSFTDLRNATRGGESGESILVRIQREGQIMDLILPRGPLGIRLDSDSVKPPE